MTITASSELQTASKSYSSSNESYKRTVQSILTQCGVTINGSASYDIQVHDERLYKRVLSEGSLGLGESYVDGWWDAEKVDEFILRLIRPETEKYLFPIAAKALILKSKFLNFQNKLRSLRVAREHYDLGNHMYSYMLDNYMQYTCGYWRNAQSLNEAQEHKLRMVCEKLQLKKTDRVLELGCGFGGLAKYISEHYGSTVVGYNISKEQVAWARNWTKNYAVEIREQDYREAIKDFPRESFDKVVSIGLIEHVGYKNYRSLFETAHYSLKKNGLFLLHGIGGNVSRVATEPWLEKYIFPGSVMPSAEQLSQAFQELFIMEDWHNYSVDYDKTLMAWFENFDKNWSIIADHEYDQRFYRMWKYYLLMCAGSFRARKNQNWEIMFSKEGGAPQEVYLSIRP
jgi:cyclopropane-fatty-acyl-phospholipid synthase